jgi:oligopeptide/dipeptide ABC transporter ATP-binding protein
MTNPLVSARGLGRRFGGVVAVSDVSLDIQQGETVALVGESGSGKTTLGRMLSLLLPPSEGALLMAGMDVAGLGRRALKPVRRNVQMIFQDPVSALNPRHTIAAILTEPLRNYRLGNAQEREARAAELLDAVGMSADALQRYPHEFSGGQRQRITIARALALNPGFIVADEPVSALDVSVQSQILNLLVELKERFSLAYLFISHDLAVVHHISDRVAVMYLGRIVEIAGKQEIFDRPGHPYTRALLNSVPQIRPGKRRIGQVLTGDPPSPAAPPSGCHFHPRCPLATDICRERAPVLEARGDREHLIACHHTSPEAAPVAAQGAGTGAGG